MNGIGKYYTECSKPYLERQTLGVLSHMWILNSNF